MMKAIRIDRFINSYDEIKISNVPKPQPQDGEVLVQIAAAGVNFVDLLYCRGKHQNNRSLVKPPFTLGLEFAGTVLSSPPSSSFPRGTKVFGGSLGSYASHICVKESLLRPIPEGWDFISAAGLAATAPVSYGALVVRGKIKKGETVLVHAAAGGLGLMAVQIAKAMGCLVIGTAGSKEKCEVARRFGADECVNYVQNDDWWKQVLDVTEGKGADVVYDPVGLVDKSLKCLKHKGRILIVGFAGVEGKIEKIAMNRVLLRQAQLIGYRFGETERRDPTENIEIWRSLEVMVRDGKVKPVVFDRQYKGLESVVPALKDLSERKVWGKAVIQADSADEKSKL
ncbi:quinone oxidoreductase [Amylocarpus encephaloides]|uniref:Quinone oxidoreductase n=1 Tax=Amylocarpus encephaloides TaxID=45428 RepID=A0A9P7YMT2_9HELO|nr:quinone oxidoreductase [Amylocarpus encephaloides]